MICSLIAYLYRYIADDQHSIGLDIFALPSRIPSLGNPFERSMDMINTRKPAQRSHFDTYKILTRIVKGYHMKDMRWIVDSFTCPSIAESDAAAFPLRHHVGHFLLLRIAKPCQAYRTDFITFRTSWSPPTSIAFAVIGLDVFYQGAAAMARAFRAVFRIATGLPMLWISNRGKLPLKRSAIEWLNTSLRTKLWPVYGIDRGIGMSSCHGPILLTPTAKAARTCLIQSDEHYLSHLKCQKEPLRRCRSLQGR